MARKNGWESPEDNFLRDCVKRGLKSPQIVIAFNSRFGPAKRGGSAILKRRTQVCADIPTLRGDTSASLVADVVKPDEDVHVNIEEGEEFGRVHVLASRSIKNPEMLFKKSGLDPDKWELSPTQHEIKKWDVPMRIKEEAVVIPCWYVSIKVRLRYEYTSMPRPVVFEMPKRIRAPAIGKQSILTTVHFSDIH